MADTSTTPPKRFANGSGVYARFGKRLVDLVIAFPLAAITLPFIAILALPVSFTFRGIPIQRSIRVGPDNSRFQLYRLRTGHSDTNDLRGPPSSFGHFLRAWSLDELPQLWNVLIGNMSLVGPRPMTPEASDELEDWELRRHEVKPGITGPWQVEARGDTRDLRDNIYYDIQYIDRLSLLVDLGYLARTVAVLLARREGDAGSGTPPARIRSRLPHVRLIAVDIGVWAMALAIAVAGRLDFSWSAIDKGDLAVATALAVFIQLAVGFAFGLYRGRWRLASYEEIGWVATTTAFVTTGLFAATLVTTPPLVPRGAVLAAAAFQLIGALGARYVARAIYTAQGKSLHQRTHNMLVFGAGEAGVRAAEAIWSDKESDALPVAFLDDDPAVWKRHPVGLPVVGGRDAIRTAARRYNADVLLIAMPSSPGPAVEAVATIANAAGLRVRIVPRLAKFMIGQGPLLVSDIRGLTLSDFLNRDEIRLDLEEITNYITGKRVLITGAGGSIGSVLCGIVEGFGPSQLFKLDHDENALHALQLETEGRALLESDDLVLCDVRDGDAIAEVFRQLKPEVVFHTAAHKHVTFLERYPLEAIKTNVVGTLNLLEAADMSGVERFVNISTDKAAAPQNALGLTKRAAEMLTSHFDHVSETSFLSVRFGNVLGSKGSVIPTFRNQIDRGEPITITHPEVSRFFMTIEEACQLVVQAGAIGGNGDVYVLDMGEPVKIVDLAHRLSAQLRPGQPVNITYTGLRPGEKLHEVLSGPDEQLLDRPHELLSRYRVPQLDPAMITDRSPRDLQSLAGILKQLDLGSRSS